MADKRTIFLTGATGNMGGATLHELMQRTDRFRVRALVRPAEKDHPILKRYAGDPAFEVVWGDLTNYDDILRGVTGADQVLHIGGMVSPLADHFPELTMKVNVGGAHNIVEAIKAQSEPDRIALVYIGTVAQTGDRSPPIHWGRTGDPINSLDAPDVEDTKVFHAGTRLLGDQVVTAGGRVLCVCALGDTVAEASERAYAEVAGISWNGEFHRHDIGWRAIARERRDA